MATDQLTLYNDALIALSDTTLASLSEDREARRVLDSLWDFGKGAVNGWLQQGLWNFAMRDVLLDSDPSVSSAFGYTYGFAKPADFTRLASISLDERHAYPLTDYEDQAGYWWLDSDPIYLRYVSDDNSYGSDFSKWPQSFIQWASLDLAFRAAPKIKSETDMEKLGGRVKMAKSDALRLDALDEGPRRQPYGSWVRARFGRSDLSRDRGKTGRLIG